MKVPQAIILLLAFSGMTPLVSQTAEPSKPNSITLYSSLRRWHRGISLTRTDRTRMYFSFAKGNYKPGGTDWDLSYGQLYIGNDKDWFVIASSDTDRSVIKDLGIHSWSSNFKVSALKPLPVLKPGEQRHLKIDASGQRGADGLPGADGADGADGDIFRASSSGEINRGAVRVGTDAPDFPPSLRPVSSWKPKPKKVTNLPVLVKAIQDHMYVVHLVKGQTDRYFLIHVDAVVTGDNCTISWKEISAPK